MLAMLLASVPTFLEIKKKKVIDLVTGNGVRLGVNFENLQSGWEQVVIVVW
jgi:hypothetical protein